MSSRKQIQAVFFSVLMVMSVIAMSAGGAAAQPSVSGEDPIEGGIQDISTGQGSTVTEQTSDNESLSVAAEPQKLSYNESVTADPQEVQVADGIQDRDGTAVLLLSVDRNIDRGAIRSGSVNAQTLEADSEATLTPVAEQVNRLGAAEVRQQFWVSNTLAVEINLDRHSIDDLAAIEGVTAITPNVELTYPSPPAGEEELTASVEQNHDFTYGLRQIDVPGFEEKYGDRGGNATVTIIDDGVSDPDNIHPDLDFAQTAIAANGSITTGTLGSSFDAHGEHVVGTVAGAANPAGDVPRYGVAPNANVIMINAFEGGATLVDILAGVEYSVEQGSDVTGMSLGFPSSTGFSTISNVVEDTMQDSVAAGTLVTVSAGNSGSGDAGGPTTSPSAEFTSMAVGASNDQGNLAPFSSGDVINPNQVELIDENGTYPDNYPREYVKPDVAAPGAGILSTGPLGTVQAENPTYSTSSGTSMAQPHVAGAATLLQSVTEEDLDPKLIEMALAETAEKPDNDFRSEFNRDIRYGTGIINVTAATDALMNGSMAVSGTVTDTAGDPIAGASVSADSGALTSTNASGGYTLHTTQEEVDITVDAFGYDASTQTVSSDDDPVDFELEDALAVDLVDGQNAFAEFGGQINVTVDVHNLETLTVDLTDETNTSQDNLTLLLNGNEQTFGEEIALDQFSGTAQVSVDIADSENLSEGQIIGLEHTFEGVGDSATVETGPTTLTEELAPAFFDLSNLNGPDELTVGNPLPLTVDVTNTGQVTATKDVQLFVAAGGLEGSLPPSSYELAPGETTTIPVNAAGVGGLFEPGQPVEAGFRSADSIISFRGAFFPVGLNDEVSTSFALQAQGSSFQVTNFTAPSEVTPGSEVEVTATVQNTGSEAGEQNVTFQFDGQTVATESVALDAYELNTENDSAEFTYTVTAPEEVGVYTHSIATDDDDVTATLGVGVSASDVTVASTSIDAGFIGTVNDDAEDVTVTADGVNLDGESVDDETLTFTVGSEPVATAEVESGTAEATFDPQTLDADAGETLTVSVEEYGVIDEAEVDTVDETTNLEDGFNLLSVPQVADLATENVSSINTWNSSAGTYDTVTASTFDSASDLHNGLYVSAAADDARLGFTFSEDVPVGGTADINPGWNLLGSNFPIDSPEAGDERSLEDDLIEVDSSALTVFDSDFNQEYDGDSTIGGYEAYWAFNDETESAEQAIISPSYEVADREEVLNIEESDFQVTFATDEQAQSTSDEFLGADEDTVPVSVTVTNEGGLDTQFVDLQVDATQDGSFELADRSLGFTLANGESETVELAYDATQTDPPGISFVAATEDDRTEEIEVNLDDGAFNVPDQALTLDDELIVTDLSFAGAATIEVVGDNNQIVGTTTVNDGVGTDVAVPIDDPANVSSTVDVQLLNVDGVEQTTVTVDVFDTTIAVENNAPAFAFQNQTVDVPVVVTNNAAIDQTAEIEFVIGGNSVDNQTVTVSDTDEVIFTADTTGLAVGDEITHTASSPDDSDTRTLTITESTVEFNDQSLDQGDEVLVEDVTTGADQMVAVTDTEFNILATTEASNLNNEDVTLDLGPSAEPGNYIAHVVASTDDISASGDAGLVNDQATIVDTEVSVNDIDATDVTEEELPVEIDTVTVDVANVNDVVGDRDMNFTVEISGAGSGTSNALTGDNANVDVPLDDPIVIDSVTDGDQTITATLVDENGTTFQTLGADVSDSATVNVDVSEAQASVELADQSLGAANGSDAVYVNDVTAGADGQFVVITPAADPSTILGETALDGDEAGEQLIVSLDQTIDAGEYRAHLVSDVSLVGQNGVVTDTGTIFETTLEFNDQEFVGASGEVNVSTADLLDGAANDTDFGIAIHETDNGSVGSIIGTTSTPLTGTNKNVTVSLGEDIREGGEYVAMLHHYPVTATNPIVEVADDSAVPVTDSATITITSESAAALNDQIPTTSADETSATSTSVSFSSERLHKR